MRARPYVLACLALVHCGGSDEGPASPGPTTSGPPPTTVEYGPQESTRLTPFPSNRYAKADSGTRTGLRVNISTATTGDPFAATFGATGAQMNELDGFSVAGGVSFHTSRALDPASLVVTGEASTKPGSPVLLVDVDPASPEKGKARPVLVKYVETEPDSITPEDFCVVVQPQTPLRVRTRYAFVTTRAVKDKSGKPVEATQASRALLDGKEPGAYGDLVTAALPDVVALGVAKGELTSATVFTTGSVHEVLLETAKTRRAAPPPELVSFAPATDDKTSKDPKRVRFVGKFKSPEYRKPAPDGKWTLDGDVGKIQSEPELELFLDVSDKDAKGKRPIVIYGHGLGGDKDGAWGTAERLADLGGAVLAIDSPFHGSRKPSKDSFPVTDFFGIDVPTATFDLGKARDNFRQMAMDQLELVRLLPKLGELDVLPLGAPDGEPDFDVSRVVYIGHSFGSVQGPGVFALAPEIRAAVWNVGGDGLTTLMRDSGTFGLLVSSFRPKGTTDGDVARFFVMTQGIMDSGDPLNFARFANLEAPPGVEGWSPRSFLIQEVINDGIVPNSSTELLARAAGATQVGPAVVPIDGLPQASAPYVGAPATGAVFQFAMADGQKASHGELIFTKDAQKQYVPFLADALAGKTPTVVPTP